MKARELEKLITAARLEGAKRGIEAAAVVAEKMADEADHDNEVLDPETKSWCPASGYEAAARIRSIDAEAVAKEGA